MKDVKIYFEELNDYADVLGQDYGVDRDVIYNMLFDYCDCEPTKNYPENYNELLNDEIKDLVLSSNLDEETVRLIIDRCDLQDILVDARLEKKARGWC